MLGDLCKRLTGNNPYEKCRELQNNHKHLKFLHTETIDRHARESADWKTRLHEANGTFEAKLFEVTAAKGMCILEPVEHCC